MILVDTVAAIGGRFRGSGFPAALATVTPAAGTQPSNCVQQKAPFPWILPRPAEETNHPRSSRRRDERAATQSGRVPLHAPGLGSDTTGRNADVSRFGQLHVTVDMWAAGRRRRRQRAGSAWRPRRLRCSGHQGRRPTRRASPRRSPPAAGGPRRWTRARAGRSRPQHGRIEGARLIVGPGEDVARHVDGIGRRRDLEPGEVVLPGKPNRARGAGSRTGRSQPPANRQPAPSPIRPPCRRGGNATSAPSLAVIGWPHGAGSVRSAERAVTPRGNHPVAWCVKPRDARLLLFVPALRVTPHPPEWDGQLSPEARFRPWQGPERATGTGPPTPPPRQARTG